MRFSVRFVQAGAQGAATLREDVVEASSEGDLRARFSAEGHVLVSVRAETVKRVARASKFNVAWWCRELRALLQAGMTVVEAIETLAESRHDAARDRVHVQLLRSLHEGQSLSRAMRSVAAFPEVLVAAVTAGERTSTLVNVLDDYLRYDEMLERLRRQAVSAAIYPMLVIGLGLVITVFLLLFVIPRFSRMYMDSPAQLSAATQAVLWVSKGLGQHTIEIAAAMVMLGAGVVWAARSGLVGRLLMRMIDAVGPLRHQWDQFRLAKLYQSLALMFRGGYTLDEALAVGEGLGLGPRLSAGLTHCREEIARGRSASRAMAGAGLTDVVTERLLAVGERSGAFDTVLQTISERHAQTFATFVERATRIVEPLMLMLVALMVGGIVVMMYMPIFDMANGIGGP